MKITTKQEWTANRLACPIPCIRRVNLIITTSLRPTVLRNV